MSKILYINNNNFHHLGRPQMCAGAWCLFGISKSHSERLWVVSAFNQEKALLVGAFSVIVRLHRLIVYSTSHNFIITAEDRGVLAVTLHA